MDQFCVTFGQFNFYKGELDFFKLNIVQIIHENHFSNEKPGPWFPLEFLFLQSDLWLRLLTQIPLKCLPIPSQTNEKIQKMCFFLTKHGLLEKKET